MTTHVQQNIPSALPHRPIHQRTLSDTSNRSEEERSYKQVCFAISGNLHTSLFQQAWQYVVDAHVARQIALHREGIDDVFPVVGQQEQLLWEQMDWRGVATEEHQRCLAQFLADDQGHRVNGISGPLAHNTLIRLADHEYWLVSTHHAELMNGQSSVVIFQNVLKMYERLCRGEHETPDDLYLSQDDGGRSHHHDQTQAKTFWRELLAGFTPIPTLPLDRGLDTPATARTQYAEQQHMLPAYSAQALQSFAQQHSLMLPTLVQAAWALLLNRYSAQADVMFGAAVFESSPDLSASKRIAEPFGTILPVRAHIRPNQTLIEWLTAIQTQQIQVRQYADSQPTWSEITSGAQLYESVLVFDSYPIDSATGREVVGAQQDHISFELLSSLGGHNFPLTLVVTLKEELHTRIIYNQQRFEAQDMARLLGHFQTLLEGMSAHPDACLDQLPLITDVERRQILLDWNATAVSYPQEVCLHTLFAEQVARTPDAPALIFENQQLTYAELDARANQLAHYLQAQGIGPDMLVGVCLERSLELVIALYATLKAGGAYVPLDPAYPQERLQFMLEDAAPAVLLTESRLQLTLPTRRAQVVPLDQVTTDIASYPTTPPVSTVTPDNLAYMIYTSGSTGRPKGAMNTHHAIVNRLLWMQDAYQLDATDRVMQKTPFSFDVSVWEFFWPLITGATLIVAKPGGHQDSLYLVDLIRQQRITTLHFVPPMLQVFLDTPGVSQDTHLRRVICSGEALPFDLQQRFFAKLNAELHNLYGPTEAAVDVSWWACQRESSRPIVPIGRPIANTQLYVLDRQLQPVPVGVAGELYIGGVQLARGYHARPALTAEKFVPDPWSAQPGQRLYKTGDLVRYVPDGAIEYLGRIDQQVKLRGFRIELGEIEAVLMQHQQVREAVVLAREDTPGDKRLVAYLVPQADDPLEIEDLRRIVAERLPEYMIPSAFVVLEALPLTPNGKVDRKALPAPDLQQRGRQRPFVAPRTPTEAHLAAIWAAVLGLETVSVDDHFFLLGGHSLLATQVVARIRATWGLDLPVRTLFEAPTIAELAPHIGQLQGLSAAPPSPPLQPVPRDAPLPLSFAQERLWFLHQLQPDSPAYNIPSAFLLHGPLDYPALQHSLSALVARHESLRTLVALHGGQPVQVILPPAPVALPVEVLPEITQATLAPLLLAASQQVFDLTRGPLLAARLVRQAPERDAPAHVLLLTLHHIIADGWSFEVLYRELTQLYAAARHGHAAGLPALAIQYADFAVWQRQWLQAGVREQQVHYWQQQLADAPFVLDLPTDFVRPRMQTPHGASVPLHCSEALTAAVQRFSQDAGVTPFMTLLAAWQALLSRYSRQRDLLVGTPIANRTRTEVEPLIGFFVNTLVLRAQLTPATPFRALVQQVRSTSLAAYAHQDLPFEMLVEGLQPERDLSRHPLFQVMFVFQNTGMAALALDGLEVTALEPPVTTAKFDLTLELWEDPTGLQGRLIYNRDLFRAETAARLATHFVSGLTAALAAPDQALATLPLLSPHERRQLLHDWNATARPYPHTACIHHIFDTQVAQRPNTLAVSDGTTQLTYAELQARANQLAHYLQALGVGPEVRVGVYLDRSIMLMVGLLGILKAGGAYVPLDPAYPQERLQFMLEDATPAVLLTESRLQLRLPAQRAQVVPLDQVTTDIATYPTTPPVSSVTPDNLAYMIYTSGSTGRPKGTLLPHRGLCNVAATQAQVFGVQPGQTMLQFASLNFDASVFEMVMALGVGARLLLVPPDLLPGPALVTLLREESVNIVTLTPSTLAALPLATLPALHTITVAGEACPPALVDSWARDRRFYNLYGPTEATIWTTAALCTPGQPPHIGHPIANVQVYILDDVMQPVPVGVAGELYIGGVQLARGYHARPALTAEKFVPDPWSAQPGQRLYKTGDLVRYVPDGAIEYLGRIDQQVKLRGFRIELGEIEAALMRHPEVHEAVVVPQKHTSGDHRLIAYVIFRAESGLDPDVLRSFLKEQLPDYMLPAMFVPLEALPLTPNGKVDRKALPVPDLQQRGRQRPFVAPRTPTEAHLAAIWAAVLGLETVSVDDHFFLLGGHSLLATQVVARIRATWGLDLPVHTLFEAPTIAELAPHIGQLQGLSAAPPSPPLQPVPRDAPLPLSFAQERLWFLHQLQPDSPAYNIPSAFLLHGPLDYPALQHSLSALVARHESLRTLVALHGGQPVQVILPPAPVALPVDVLPEITEATLAPLLLAASQQVFDLTRGPLLAARLVRQAPERDAPAHVLLLTLHHIIADGWSFEVLYRELTQLYAAARHGHAAGLPALAIQYADFAVWQRQWLQAGVREQQVHYWQQQLADAPFVLDLPTDFVRPPVQTFNGAIHTFTCSEALTAAVQRFSQDAGVTPFMTLLAAWQALLSRYSRQRDLLVGTPIANRTRTEVEPLIGFFVNTLVLRAQLTPATTFRALVQQVRSTSLAAYAHQDLPFEMLVEGLQPERDLSRHPLFQVMFVFQNTGMAALALDGLEVTALEPPVTTAKFDLTLELWEDPTGLQGRLIYNRDLFRAETVARLATHFVSGLTAALAAPDQALATLPLLSPHERRQLLHDWNATALALPEVICTHHRFATQAATTRNAPAVADSRVSLSYAQLDAQANQLAHVLQQHGVGPDQPVAVCIERSVQFVIAALAVLKAGGAYLPLDPALPSARLGFLLGDSRAAVLLTQESLLSKAPDPAALPIICLDRDAGLLAAAPITPPASLSMPDHLAYIIYTSGSTGTPKGVGITHRQLANLVGWHLHTFAVQPSDRASHVAGLGFDAAVWELWPYLLTGASVIFPDEATRADLPRMLEWMAAQRITISFLPTPMAEVALSLPWPEDVSLRLLLTGGDRLQGYPPATLPCTLVNNYGPTETAVVATSTIVLPEHSGLPPIGRPIANTQIYLLDQAMQPVPIGVAGEIYIGGDSVARGYWQRPDLTAEAFVPDPFGEVAGARLYKTSDLACFRADGQIEYLGRIDHQVKVRGFRIELGEIEAVLRQHPDIRETLVLVREDSPGGKQIVAYVVAATNTELDLSQLRGFLRDRLPEYMIPSAFIPLAAFPQTPNGKIDRQALPAPEASRPQLEVAYVAPQTQIERTLATIWSETLHVEQVGLYDNFFDLGGHSLLIASIHGRLCELLERDIPMIALFKHTNISALAKYLSQDQPVQPTQAQFQDRTQKRREALSRQASLMKGRKKTNG